MKLVEFGHDMEGPYLKLDDGKPVFEQKPVPPAAPLSKEIIQAKLTGSTLVTPDLPFFQYSVDVIWQMNAQPASFVSRIFK
jgi:hypothetical protein